VRSWICASNAFPSRSRCSVTQNIENKTRPSSAVQNSHALKRAHPQSVPAIKMQIDNASRWQLRRVMRIKHGKRQTIKSYQSIKGAKPYISVGRLHHGGCGVFRQAMFGFPRRDQILIIIDVLIARDAKAVACEQMTDQERCTVQRRTMNSPAAT
jgi:hypothetical protein